MQICPDKICLRSDYISKIGETVVCLPHKVVIEIKGKANIEDEEQTYIWLEVEKNEKNY